MPAVLYIEYLVLTMIISDTPWDGTINGKPAPSGVYVWTIKYIRYSNLNQTLLRRGTVTLVR